MIAFICVFNGQNLSIRSAQDGDSETTKMARLAVVERVPKEKYRSEIAVHLVS